MKDFSILLHERRCFPAELQYIVRDHDAASFEVRQKTLSHIAEILNEKWGKGTVTLTITQQYRNMKEVIDTCPWLIILAEEACRNCDVAPLILPIRGGTDGAQLSFMGLPCRIWEPADMPITGLMSTSQWKEWMPL